MRYLPKGRCWHIISGKAMKISRYRVRLACITWGIITASMALQMVTLHNYNAKPTSNILSAYLSPHKHILEFTLTSVSDGFCRCTFYCTTTFHVTIHHSDQCYSWNFCFIFKMMSKKDSIVKEGIRTCLPAAIIVQYADASFHPAFV